MFVYLYRKLKSKSAQEGNVEKKPEPSCQHQLSTATAASAPDGSRSQKCETCAAEKSAARKYRWKLLFYLLPGLFLASLDLTIVATALPFIASHFDKFNQLNWIVTAFTLTSTAFIPVFGQLADTFGRHSGLQFAVCILTIGSILCATAPVWPVLLLGRALQGVGTAGVSNISMIVLADSVSLREQAVNTSIFQLMNGIGYSVGPVIGGYITNSNWRYAFVLCAGMGALSCGTIFLLRNDLKPGKISVSRPSAGQSRSQTLRSGLSTLDFGGIILFTLGVGLIILGTAWGGSTFAWKSAAVLVSLVVGVVLLICFCAYEYLLEPGRLLSKRFPTTVPLIPFNLLRNKDIGLVCCVAAATGAALYSVFYFIGIYFTLVEAYQASKAGIQLLYYVPGIGVGVYSAIYLCNVRPRQTFWPLFLGTIVETGGVAALTYAVKSRNSTLVNVMMGIAGAGTGARFMPSNLHLAGMFRDRLAPVYSMLRFALPFGGTLALTIMGSVFQNKMAVYFGNVQGNNGNGSSPGGFSLHNQAALEAINQLPVAQQKIVRSAGANATMWAFVSILPILGLSLIASMGLGNVWISPKKNESSGRVSDQQEVDVDTEAGEKRNDPQADSQGANVGKASGGMVLDTVYLLALLRGRVKAERRVAGIMKPQETLVK